MISFQQYKEQNTVGYHNDGFGGFVSQGVSWTDSSWTGSEQNPTMGLQGHSLWLPSPEVVLNLPSIKRVRKIQSIETQKNPITIRLDDGTTLHFTLDEFRKIKRKPEVGRVLSVTFQRNSEDNSKNHSQISSIKVF